MDQYYWYVDEETLIGYQWPVALVAIKPKRVVTDRLSSGITGLSRRRAPTAERYFIDDSDDFFMIEPQSRETGRSMIRWVWITVRRHRPQSVRVDDKEQRECGRQLLKFHAADLPENVDESSRNPASYMAEIYSRLTPDTGAAYRPFLSWALV